MEYILSATNILPVCEPLNAPSLKRNIKYTRSVFTVTYRRLLKLTYRQVSNIRRPLAGYKIVDHSDVVGASHVGAAPTTSSFST